MSVQSGPERLVAAIQDYIDGNHNQQALKPVDQAVKNQKMTPESAFHSLDKLGWAYQVKYVDWNGLKMAYVDETKTFDCHGNQVDVVGDNVDERIWLCLHGQPTWSFLYRKMIPVFLNDTAGEISYDVDNPNVPSSGWKFRRNRVICPDLIGFGKSSKPVDDQVYTYEFHITSLVNFILNLELYKKQVTLVVQDWGGLLGTVIPSLFNTIKQSSPPPFQRLLVMNTVLPLGRPPGKGFRDWKKFAGGKDFDIGGVIYRGNKHLSNLEVEAYRMPWPDVTFKAGVRRFPLLVPTSSQDHGHAYGEYARQYYQEKFWNNSNARIFVCLGTKDPVFGKSIMQQTMKDLGGSEKMYYAEHPHAGHFVQEWGGWIASEACRYFNLSKPLPLASKL